MPMIASTFLGLGLFVDQTEHLFQPLDVAFRLFAMLLKGGGEILGIRGLFHFRQRGQNFLFREIDVLQRLEKQLVELLGFLLRHGRALRIGVTQASTWG